jgi:hypothetical protein
MTDTAKGAITTGDRRPSPDFIYDPENWEITYCWSDRGMLAEHELDDCAREIKKFHTLFEGPPKWAVNVPTAFDEDGLPEEWETRWFDTEAEAQAACDGAPEAPPDRSEASHPQETP